MKNLEKTFQTILLTVSGLALFMIFYKLLTTQYDSENLAAIFIFIIPVFFAFIFSGSLLIQNFKK